MTSAAISWGLSTTLPSRTPGSTDVFWTGAKYTFWKQLDLTGAIYGLHQNAYIANDRRLYAQLQELTMQRR